VVHYVLRELGLPVTNLIYAGGGNFYLLAPIGYQTKIADVAKAVSQKLLQAHDGELNVLIGYTPVTKRQFIDDFGSAWQALQDETKVNSLGQAKRQPLANLDNNILIHHVGQARGEGGDEDTICRICGREDKETKPKDSGGDIIRVCPLCVSFEELGNDLVKASHLITLYSNPKDHTQQVNRWWQGLELFGFNFWAVNGTKPPKKELGKYFIVPDQTHWVEITELDPTKYTSEFRATLANISTPRLNTNRLFAQLVAKDYRGDALTFDELAENETDKAGFPSLGGGLRWNGFKRWGVLRMDVDNLGKLFQSGFKDKTEKNRMTLARSATLSFALRLFFEGWLPQLGEQSQRMKNRLYIQYAGGDDVFAVGSWDALPEFASAIRESLQEYVGHNPAITLSGGVALATVKYPLYRVADEADEAEKAAKGYREAKNAFNFLSHTVAWEDFGKVMALAYQLADWCDDPRNGIMHGADNEITRAQKGKVSRALLQGFMAIHQEYRKGRKDALKLGKWKVGQVYYGSWMWHLAYQLARRLEDRQTPESVKTELRKLEKKMLDTNEIETVGLAARWAQYLVRK